MKLLDYYTLQQQERRSWADAPLPVLEAALLARDPQWLERVLSLWPSEEERFAGDLVAIDRGPLFVKLDQLCLLYSQSSPEQRTYLRRLLDQKRGDRLHSFGLRAAVLALREQSPERMQVSLAAFAMADIVGDVREVLMSMAVLLYCAQRCGADADRLFHEAAGISGPAMAAVLVDFLSRGDGERELGVMGWRMVQTPEGPGFRFGRP